MRKTIYLSDELAAQVEAYLQHHRGKTFSSLVQEVLEREVAPPDLTGLLNLAGFVTVPSRDDGRQREDQVVDLQR